MPKKKPTATDSQDTQTVSPTATTNNVTDEPIHQSDNNTDDNSTENICINTTQQIEAQGIVKNHIIMSVTTGFIALPLIDIAALTTLQLHMLQSLSNHFNVDFEKKSAKSLLTALMTGSLPVLGVAGMASLSKAFPGIGTLGGGAALSLTSGTIIYAMGQVFITHFSQGGTFSDLNTKQAQQVFKQECKQGKVFVKGLISKKSTDKQTVTSAA